MYKNLKTIAESSKNNEVIDEYVESNDKTLIPKLLKIIENDEELSKANEEAKATCTLLYRGLAIDKPMKDEDILDFEKKQDFVATSRSEHIAKDYAKGKGQIGGKLQTDSVYAVVLVYDVTTNNDVIAFDSRIFEKEHATLETVIKPKEAKLARIDYILSDAKQ